MLPAPIGAPASGEVISRVQVQNLEHNVYQKLMRDLDDRIAQVVQERFMPEIGEALDNALTRISVDINHLVQASIDETLRTQIKNLRVAVEAKAAMREATAAAPAGLSAAADAGGTLAKSFEPAAIEAGPGEGGDGADLAAAGLSDGLTTALAELSAEHRAVVVLRYLLDYTPAEIAKALNLPRGTVNSRLRRALDRLAGVYGEELR
jgi:RNA polymerase sigma factor (sigma-70 family)